jgi:Prokaryotic Cytochrome C oxidase subunit IV
MTTHTTPSDRTRGQRAAWVVWGVLVTATLAGWLLHDADGTNAGKVIVSVIVLLALGKCWLIVQYFMEVRHAPRWLQIATTGWMVVLCGALLVLFLRA